MKFLLPFLCLCFFNLAFNSKLTGQIPCSNNTDCIFSTNISFPDSIKTVCVNGCNVDMPLATFCGGSMVSSAWYKFNTGNNNAIIIDISSGDLTTPIVALVENCNTILSCESKIGNLAMNSEYYIVVADQNNLQGDFSLCLTLSRDSSLCIRDESLVVTNTSLGSPLDGPYFPGETLTFTYSTSFFAGGGCQWLHSFIPILSKCWGDEIPHLLNPRIGSQLVWASQGTMTWKPTDNYPASAIGINDEGQLCLIGSAGCQDFVGGGLCGMTGTPMPAGWASITTSGTCGFANEPNLAWGIPQGCGSLKERSLLFTIKIPEDAKDCIAENGLTIGLAAFTDGATGGYNNASCNGNGFDLINIFTNDCVPPTLTVMNDTICSGTNIDANIILVPDTSSIIWTVGNIPGIKGSYNGSGKSITQELQNTTDHEISVQYKIRAVGGDGCVGATQLLDILVYPEVTSNIDNQFVCSDSLIEISSMPTGGAGGPYDHLWSTGASHINTLSFKTTADTSITVTIIDGIGCRSIDTIRFEIMSSSPIIKPIDTSLIGNLLVSGNIIQNFSVGDFENAEDYTWTLDGIVIGRGQEISYMFDNVTNGIHSLCVVANNCSLLPETLCWDILVKTLGNHDIKKHLIKVYPNPNDGYFNLELAYIMEGNIEIYDLNGRQVYNQKLDKSNLIQQINVGLFPPALYNIILRNEVGKIIGCNKFLLHKN